MTQLQGAKRPSRPISLAGRWLGAWHGWLPGHLQQRLLRDRLLAQPVCSACRNRYVKKRRLLQRQDSERSKELIPNKRGGHIRRPLLSPEQPDCEMEGGNRCSIAVHSELLEVVHTPPPERCASRVQKGIGHRLVHQALQQGKTGLSPYPSAGASWQSEGQIIAIEAGQRLMMPIQMRFQKSAQWGALGGSNRKRLRWAFRCVYRSSLQSQKHGPKEEIRLVQYTERLGKLGHTKVHGASLISSSGTSVRQNTRSGYPEPRQPVKVTCEGAAPIDMGLGMLTPANPGFGGSLF